MLDSRAQAGAQRLQGENTGCLVRCLTDEEELLSDPQNLLLFGHCDSISLRKTKSKQPKNNKTAKQAEAKTTNETNLSVFLLKKISLTLGRESMSQDRPVGALGRCLQAHSWASHPSKGHGEDRVSGDREPTELWPVCPQHKPPGPPARLPALGVSLRAWVPAVQRGSSDTVPIHGQPPISKPPISGA